MGLLFLLLALIALFYGADGRMDDGVPVDVVGGGGHVLSWACYRGEGGLC